MSFFLKDILFWISKRGIVYSNTLVSLQVLLISHSVDPCFCRCVRPSFRQACCQAFGHFLSSISCSCIFQLKTLHLFSPYKRILHHTKFQNPGKLSYLFKHLFYFPSEAQFYTNLIWVNFVFFSHFIKFGSNVWGSLPQTSHNKFLESCPLPPDRPVWLSQLFRPIPVKNPACSHYE